MRVAIGHLLCKDTPQHPCSLTQRHVTHASLPNVVEVGTASAPDTIEPRPIGKTSRQPRFVEKLPCRPGKWRKGVVIMRLMSHWYPLSARMDPLPVLGSFMGIEQSLGLSCAVSA